MKKTIAVFMRHGSRWDPDRPVREQDYWDDHARFMDALFDAGTVVLGGPFVDGTGSLVILEADSPQAARSRIIGEGSSWKMSSKGVTTASVPR